MLIRFKKGEKKEKKKKNYNKEGKFSKSLILFPKKLRIVPETSMLETLYGPRTFFSENESSFFRERSILAREPRIRVREIVIICRVYQLKQKKIPCQSNTRRPALFNLTNASRHCSRFKNVIHRFVIN